MTWMKPRMALFGALVWTLAACTGGPNDGLDGLETERSTVQRELSPAVPAADQATLVDGAMDFSLDLYQRLAGDPGAQNLFFSPYSISLALSMTWAGAHGQTATGMSDTLRFDLPQDRHHAAANWLDLALESRGQGAAGTDGAPFRLRLTNALFGQQNMKWEAPFLDALALNYGAGMNLVDFRGATEAARQTINQWVAGETEQLIPELLQAGDVDPYTALVLVNAIYFNAAWASQFSEYRTLRQLLSLLQKQSVKVGLPRFRLDARFQLAPVLAALGMPTPFDQGLADFSGMIRDRATGTVLFLGRVLDPVP